jgi:hypothetical protein
MNIKKKGTGIKDADSLIRANNSIIQKQERKRNLRLS